MMLADPTPKGALGISGDSLFTVRVISREDDTGIKMPITKAQVDQAIIVIEKRLKSLGFTKPRVSRQGEDRFLVRLQGISPDQSPRIVAAIEKVGKLELREVSPRSEEPGPDGKTLAQRVQDGSELVPGYRAFTLKGKDEDGNEYKRPILLNRRMALGGKDIASAVASPQQADAVDITLNGDGTDKMIAITKNMRPQVDRIAIVLDGEVLSAPVVIHVPLGKRFIIEGLREPGEVQSLANSLMNPLESALVVEEERTISAQKDAK